MRKDRVHASRAMGLLGAAFLGTVLASCSPPPANLAVGPPAAKVVARFGDDQATTPKSISFKLTSDQPNQSVGWTAVIQPAWLTPSGTAGGTPADFILTVDEASVRYGDNQGSVRFDTKQGPVLVPVTYTALGCLSIGPTQIVTLEGNVGDPASESVELTVDSPGKPGLRWSVQTDDPWLKVATSEGVTPAKVSVTADLTKAADNISGRLTFHAESAWKGATTVIPVTLRLLNPEAVRKQLDSKVQIIKSDIEKFKSDLRDRFTESLKTKTPDALIAALKKVREDTRAQEVRIRAQLDDLTAFMDQNAEFEKKLAFPETRTWAEKTRAEGDTGLKDLEGALDGIKDVRVSVDSARGEWQDVGVSARPGDLIGFEASGKWSLGPLAGGVGPEGFKSGEHANASIYNLPHGCLMLRVGEKGGVFAAAGTGLLQVSGEGGEVSARCNDKEAANNRGSISVRVVVVPTGK